jgi:hypothetical protein
MPACWNPFPHLTLLSEEQHLLLSNRMQKNFWKAIEFIARVIPKDVMVSGSVEHHGEVTLRDRVERAHREDKSPEVRRMIEHKTLEGVTEYRVEEEDEEGERECTPER